MLSVNIKESQQPGVKLIFIDGRISIMVSLKGDLSPGGAAEASKEAHALQQSVA